MKIINNMKKRLTFFLQTFILLITSGISVQAQPVPINIPSDIPSGSENFAAIGEYLYFKRIFFLYRTDGTNEGTIFLRSPFYQDLSVLSEFKGMAIWIEDTALWRSDGTQDGTIPLTISALSNLQIIDSTENFLFFQGYDPASGLELYRTDGTVEGTLLLKDIHPGSEDGYSGAPVLAGNELFFSGDDGTHGRELWKTDGTTAGTMMVKDINPGSADGFTGPSGMVVTGDIFFSANDGVHGSELWKTDGTSGGTVMVKDIEAGAEDGFLGEGLPVGNSFYLNSNAELWISDGTEAGTGFIKNIDPVFIADASGRLFIYTVITSEPEIEVWKSDGTASSTFKLINLDPPAKFDSPFLVYEDKIYFVASGPPVIHHVWKTDGTESGTSRIFSETLDGSIEFFELVNGRLYFYTRSQGNNIDLHVVDAETGWPTAGRPFRNDLGGAPIKMAAVGDFVFFSDHDGPSNGDAHDPEDAFQLFQTDGSTIQTLKSMFGTSFHNTQEIIDYNGRVVFRSKGEWWIYDPRESPGSFTLVNADTNEDIQTLAEGDEIALDKNTHYNIRYNHDGNPGSVVFEHNGRIVRTENAAPFALAGDRSGDYLSWDAVTPGNHKVTATAYPESNGNGTPGITQFVNFTILAEAETDTFTLVNADTDEDIQMLQDGDVFVKPADMNINIRYNPVSVPYSPVSTASRVVFKHNNNIVRRESHAPYALAGDRNGDYMRWDGATPGDHTVEATLYAEVEGHGPRPFPVGPALVVNFTIEETTDNARYAQIAIFPNPLKSNDRHLFISGFEGNKETSETQVEIINITGVVIFAERISCDNGCGGYNMSFDKPLSPGVYLVNMESNGRRLSKRLLVK